MKQMKIKPGVRRAALARRKLDGQLEIEAAYFKRTLVLPDGLIERVSIKSPPTTDTACMSMARWSLMGRVKGDMWHQ